LTCDFARKFKDECFKSLILCGFCIGSQFIAKDFKEFIRISGMTRVRTSPYYPQSNGKIKRWHRSLKGECIRPGTPLSLEDARRLVEGSVEHYNNVRLNIAIGYITPKDMLAGRQQEIHADRDRKLAAAFVASEPREKAKTLVSWRFRVTDEVDYFRMADIPSGKSGDACEPLGLCRLRFWNAECPRKAEYDRASLRTSQKAARSFAGRMKLD